MEATQFPTIVYDGGNTEKPFILRADELAVYHLTIPQLLHIVQKAAEAVQQHAGNLGWQQVIEKHDTIFPGSELEDG